MSSSSVRFTNQQAESYHAYLPTRGALPPNKRLELTAPLGGRAGNGVVDGAASRSPFGERRRRSSSAVFAGPEQSGGTIAA
jgi:hypothetical protein